MESPLADFLLTTSAEEGIEVMLTKISKEISGWKARSETPFASDQTLQLTTAKASSGAITSTLRVLRIEGNWETFVYGRDLSVQVAIDRFSRCTEKVVALQHQGCVARLDEYQKLATAHYANEDLQDQERLKLQSA